MDYNYDEGTNGTGRRTSMSSGGITSSWSYDERGRVLSETSLGYTTGYSYNSADLPMSMTYPDNEVVAYEYNSSMLLETLSGTANYVTGTTYDPAGRITSRALGNGLSQSFEYYAWDEKAMVDGILTGQGGRLKTLSAGTLQSLGYLYDASGNIRTINDTLVSELQAFGYDELDRLRSATVTGGPAPDSEGYTYDPTTGNLQSKGSPSDTYAYQATAQDCRVLGPNGNLITGERPVAHAVSGYKGNAYGYDCNGNMSIRQIASGPLAGEYSLGYDAENRLVSVSGPNGFAASFVYNGDGQRVQSTIA